MNPFASHENEQALLEFVGPVLVGSPFERRRRWRDAVVVLRREEKRVTSRGDFAQWLTANDLRNAARECIARRVPSGHVLVWLEVDSAAAAMARFVVLNVVRALRAEVSA
jgi:hypothetical protein